MNKRTVLILIIIFNWDFEHCSKELERIQKLVSKYPVKPVMHGKRQIALVIQSDETAEQLMKRLADVLTCGAVENAWCYSIGESIRGLFNPDPLTERVREAWAEVRKFNNPKYVPKIDARDIFLKKGVHHDQRRAAVKKGIKGSRVR